MTSKRKTARSETERSERSVRCAIYTRKSTDEGLDQDFNSLDAQREAAEAFIESQKHEGWTCLSDRYDDGGFSGGNIERPALKRLLSDVKEGKVDCIVVYKVDRLSRSLLDFARIMETLEQNHAAFVSVTQQFNTSHSMGRLTLNILLSFAQFEREIIAERTRDKMSGARRKGKWTGGMPVLGYDVDPKGGRLLVNEEEALQVRKIYELYLERQSLIETAKELNRRDWTTKEWVTKDGRERVGRPFTKTNLFSLLTNIVYVGKVKYDGSVYEGEHEAIVDEDLWRSVQALLRRNGRNGGKEVRNKYGSLLRGILYCIPCSAAMTHTYTARNPNKQYRYYVCSKAQKQGWDSCPTKSLPAGEIERFVVDRIRRAIGKDPSLIKETLVQARMEKEKRISDLQSELRILEQGLKRSNDEARKLVGEASRDAGDEPTATGRLADLLDRVRADEQRAARIREEILAQGQGIVDQKDLATALAAFDPVWDSLSPKEQARVMHLLLERIGYDGDKGRVTLTFRPNGIKTLVQRVNMVEEGIQA